MTTKELEKKQLNNLSLKCEEIEQVINILPESKEKDSLLILHAELNVLIGCYKELIRRANLVCTYRLSESKYEEYKKLFYREYKKIFRDTDST